MLILAAPKLLDDRRFRRIEEMHRQHQQKWKCDFGDYHRAYMNKGIQPPPSFCQRVAAEYNARMKATKATITAIDAYIPKAPSA